MSSGDAGRKECPHPFWFCSYFGWTRCKLTCTVLADKNIFFKSKFYSGPKQLQPWKTWHFSLSSIFAAQPVLLTLELCGCKHCFGAERATLYLFLPVLPAASDCMRQEQPKRHAKGAFCHQLFPIREVWAQSFSLTGMNCLSSFFPCSNSLACELHFKWLWLFLSACFLSSGYRAGAALAGSEESMLGLGTCVWGWG